MIRNNGKKFNINWAHSHLDLTACDLESIKFIDDSQFSLFRLDSEILKTKLPYFLPLSCFDNMDSFKQSLANFNIHRVWADQIRFFQWSILFQTLNCSRKDNVQDYLNLLMEKPFMKKRDYLSSLEVAGNFFSTLFYQNTISQTEMIGRVDIAEFVSQLTQGKLPGFTL